MTTTLPLCEVLVIVFRDLLNRHGLLTKRIILPTTKAITPNHSMREDFWKILSIFACGAACGQAIGYPWQGMLLAAVVIIFWQMRQLQKLYLWVRNPNTHAMPESTGQLHLLQRELSRKARSTRMRKRQLTSLFSQFRQAVSVLPDAIVLIDTIGQIRWANKNAEDMFGIRWPADANLRLTHLVRDPVLESHLSRSSNASCSDEDDMSTIGIEVKAKQEPDQVLNVKVIPYTDDLRMILARDVTRLMKVNRVHSDFVANVSHELKTPLTVLRGYLEILQSNPKLDAALQRPIGQMTLQSERMQLIVQDLLFLSKLEDPHKKDKLEPIDIATLISTIIEMIQPNVAERTHELELDIDHYLRILGDPNELHSAFTNLILNAVNYTPEKGVIKVCWREQKGVGVFQVIDNGPGIPAHHLGRLTERFYRIDTDRSREGGGTGLGLAIVKHVIQRHDGRLEIESKEGVGSSFTCLFPAARLSSLAQPNIQQAN